MIVSDASGLNYLVQLGLQERLFRRYGAVAIPEAVSRELSHARTPAIVRRWISDDPPVWLQFERATPLHGSGLHPGEAEAIPLAEHLGVTLLVDEVAARRVAIERGLPIVGTLGFLALEAGETGLDFDATVDALLRLGFRARADLIERLRAGV